MAQLSANDATKVGKIDVFVCLINMMSIDEHWRHDISGNRRVWCATTNELNFESGFFAYFFARRLVWPLIEFDMPSGLEPLTYLLVHMQKHFAFVDNKYTGGEIYLFVNVSHTHSILLCMSRGTLIVIDGSDGSGKATQTKLLVEKLRAQGVDTETLDFPRYADNLVGKLIGECIAGEHGDFLHSDPFVASVLYGADRFESRGLIESWLAAGKTVVLDRYVSANQIHQGGKIADDAKRAAFLEWLDKLEYGVFGLPRPNLTLYLRMPTELSVDLLKDKRAKEKKSSYLTGDKQDTVELDIAYLEHAQMSAQWLMQHQKGWERIECAPAGTIRSREDIHEEVLSIVTRVLPR